MISRSKLFHELVKFPTHFKLDNRIEKYVDLSDPVIKINKLLNDFAAETKPFTHIKVKNLINNFLNLKQTYDNPFEQSFYNQYSYSTYSQRLLTKRPIAFMARNDIHLLIDGTMSSKSFDNLSESKDDVYNIYDYISYDEMLISALFSVAVPTYFINSGSRRNEGIRNMNFNEYTTYGIYIGSVGCRFERPGLMEWQHMLITSEQNTYSNGYGQPPPTSTTTTSSSTTTKESFTYKQAMLSLWAEFYSMPESSFPTYDEVKRLETTLPKSTFNKQYISFTLPYSNEEVYFNIHVYKQRMRIVIESFLFEANDRGKRHNKQVYIRAVGLGLGVWAINKDIQTTLLLQVYNDILNQHNFSHISDLEFLYFTNDSTIQNEWIGKMSEVAREDIHIHFTNGNPADLIPDDKLLVCQYAWDGNSYPGREAYTAEYTVYLAYMCTMYVCIYIRVYSVVYVTYACSNTYMYTPICLTVHVLIYIIHTVSTYR